MCLARNIVLFGTQKCELNTFVQYGSPYERHKMSYKVPLTSTTDFGSMKVGTGLSVTDGTVSAGAGLLNYGFFENGTQTNPVASAVNTMTFTVTGPSNGISIVGGNQITVVNAGTYTKTFTMNVNKTSGGTSTISIWLRLDGVDVPGSRQDLDLTNTLSQIFVSGNFTLNVPAGGNIQLCWSSADTTVQIAALPAAVTPTRPTGASVKLTMTRIS